MSENTVVSAKGNKNTYLIIAAVVVILGVLLYFEQIALLYVISSVALIFLLLWVAFSDLENAKRNS